MRDIHRLDAFYVELKEIHKKAFPDWRFGQLIANVLGEELHGRDLFFPEDKEMIGYFRRYADKYVPEWRKIDD